MTTTLWAVTYNGKIIAGPTSDHWEALSSLLTTFKTEITHRDGLIVSGAAFRLERRDRRTRLELVEWPLGQRS